MSLNALRRLLDFVVGSSDIIYQNSGMTKRKAKLMKQRDYRPHGLGNRNAARKGDQSFLLTIDGKQVSGIDQVTGRVTFANVEAFPLVFNTGHGFKAFLRKAARLGNEFSADRIEVIAMGSRG